MVTSKPLNVQQLSQLTDANLSGMADNDLLAYDNGSGKWTNQTASAAGVAAASHTHTTSDITGFTEAVQDIVGSGSFIADSSSIDVTYNDGSNTFSLAVIPGGVDHGSLAGLGDDDHTIYLKADGTRALSGDISAGTHKITNLGTPSSSADAATKGYVDGLIGGATDLDGLTDVVITTPASGQLLKHNGTNWVNATLDLDGLSDVVITTAASGHFLRHNGTNWINVALVAGDLPAMVGDSGSGGTKGAVPAPASGDAAAGAYLKADGTWAVPAGGSGSSHYHDPVKCVTTANVSLSGGGIANGTTHDGIAVTTGQRIGVVAQSSTTENGIYIVPASGAASRASDMATSHNASGDEFNVQAGTLYADYKAIVTSNSSVVGTDPITVALVNLGASNVTANYFAGAGPESGSPAPPSPRKLVPADYSHLAIPNHNLLFNPGMELCQRVYDPTVGWSVNDNSYGVADRFKLLSSGSTVESSRATGTGAKRLVLKNDTASSNRFGAIQVISGVDSRPYRSQTMVAFAHLLCSQTKNARIALLEWTGTEDSPTTDVVRDWTSGTFTPNNFFLTSNLTVVGTTQVALTANTLTQVSVTGAVSGSCKNLIWMVWTEDTISANATFEIEQPGLYLGSKVVEWKPRPFGLEEALCLPFCEAIESLSALDYGTGFNSASNQRRTHFYPFRARKRVIPTGYHNITGFASTTPGSKQIGIYDFVLAAQQTINGALTMGITAYSQFRYLITAAAGTSFPSGATGNPMSMQFGADVVIYFDADF